MDDEELTPSWYPYESGATVGQRGPEGGAVLSDEELGDPDDPEDADARLTLERGENFHTVVANLYGGWLYLACERTTEADARSAYEALRGELEKLTALIPMDDERDIPTKVKALLQSAAEVESRFASPDRKPTVSLTR